MRAFLLFSILLLAPLAAGAAANPEPFEARFDPQGIGRGITPRIIHRYDPKLPGYVIEAEIATVILRPRGPLPSKGLPGTLVLAIRTSSAQRPMLESFALISPEVTVRSALSSTMDEEVTPNQGKVANVPRGTYFRFQVVGREVRVTLLPKAMALLGKGCKVEWIDWYR